MIWYDWLILILPVCFVMYMGFHSRRYVRGVSDFLSAGRLCGRYVISMGQRSRKLALPRGEEKSRDMNAERIERNVLYGFSVMIWLERRADCVWRAEKLHEDLETFCLGVDSRLGFDGEYVFLALNDES